MLSADLATGKVEGSITVPGQLTSAVPAASGIVGVQGGKFVSVPAKGKPTVVATVAGSAYELRPTADGGVSFLRTESGSHTSTVAHEHAGVVTTLGSGELARMHLFQGRDGHAVLSGASTVDAPALAMAGVISVGDKALPHGATGSSLDGDALAGPDADGQKAEPVVLATKIGQLLGRSCPASTGKASSATAAFVVTAAPSSVFSAQVGKPQPQGDAAPAADSAAPKAVPAAQTPMCAVPRLNAARQAMQPNDRGAAPVPVVPRTPGPAEREERRALQRAKRAPCATGAATGVGEALAGARSEETAGPAP